MISRRKLLLGGALLAADLGWAGPAFSSTSIALTLPELRSRARRVVVGTPVLHDAEWVNVGGSQRIITKTRFVQENDWLRSSSPTDRNEDEFMIWTLGGRVGNLAQKVPGEARLPLNEQVLLFVGEGDADHERIIGMSQGSYPVEATKSGRRLNRSRSLAHLVGDRPGPDAPSNTQAAVDLLHHCEFSHAFSLIRGVK